MRLYVSWRLLIFNCLFISQHFGVFVMCSHAIRLFCLPFEITFHFDIMRHRLLRRSSFFAIVCTHTHTLEMESTKSHGTTNSVSAVCVMQCDTRTTLTCNRNSVFLHNGENSPKNSQFKCNFQQR